MSPSDDDFEDLERKVDNVESSVDDLNIDLEDLNYDIEQLRFSKEDYEIYHYPSIIQRYQNNLVKVQQRPEELFFPSSEERIKEYFKNNFASFDYNKIKYESTIDFSIVGKIVSSQGRSGSSFIENIDNVILINKPLLLFYGIEQIAAFYSNLHFNFTWDNNSLNTIRSDLAKHGIDALHFKNKVNLKNPIEDLLNKKIKLEKTGLVQRFFLAFDSRFLQYFTQRLEITFIDLIKLFYLFCPIPHKTKEVFIELFGSKHNLPRQLLDFYINYRNKLNIFSIYLLSFILCHLCRYKLYAWTILLDSEEKNIGYFIRFFLNYSKKYFTKTIFDSVYSNEQAIKRIEKFGSPNRLF